MCHVIPTTAEQLYLFPKMLMPAIGPVNCCFAPAPIQLALYNYLPKAPKDFFFNFFFFFYHRFFFCRLNSYFFPNRPDYHLRRGRLSIESHAALHLWSRPPFNHIASFASCFTNFLPIFEQFPKLFSSFFFFPGVSTSVRVPHSLGPGSRLHSFITSAPLMITSLLYSFFFSSSFLFSTYLIAAYL